MKNVNSMKSTGKIESPKTPGGISKSLLTPCRRLGLSRSWRKSGPSPFISPLSNSPSNVTETKQENITRKRKTKDSPEKDNEENADDTNSSLKNSNLETDEDLKTPTRTNINRKRCKTLILTENSQESECLIENPPKENLENVIAEEPIKKTKVSKLSRQHSKPKSSQNLIEKANDIEQSKTIETKSPQILEQKQVSKNKSLQNLTTECIVVLQKEIINKVDKPIVGNKPVVCPKTSQALFDSDSDDVPLCQINKKPKTDTLLNSKLCNESDKDKEPSKDILPSNNLDKNSKKITKLEDKKTSTTDLKSVTKKTKPCKKITIEKIAKLERIPSSQSSNSFEDDDDDFDFKKTIIIKKSYDKVPKPVKAKSTGSITEKDIIDLKARIEAKKKILLAKTLDSDTEELRGLIRKWQKGCQDALVELVDLMKKKMPEQSNMENAHILQMLNIPPDLVGYDSENDCFNPPNDTKIILSSLKI